MAEEAEAKFELPEILENSEGWGPSATISKLQGVPFAPFNKSDRIGRVSDWNQPQQRAGQFRAPGGLESEVFPFKQDETSFSLVDNRPKPKPKYKRYQRNYYVRRGGQQGWGRGRGGGRGRGRGGQDSGRRGGRGGYWQKQRRWGYNQFGQQQKKDPSIPIDKSWEVVREFDFKDLSSVSIDSIPRPEDLTTCGLLKQYNPDYDRIAPKTAKQLLRYQRVEHFTVTTQSDSQLKKLAKAKSGNVYATDTILGVLMSCTRSVIGWDIIVEKKGGDLYFDKRPNSRIDFLTVNENWNEVATTEKDSPNHPDRLSYEATLISHNFSQQVLDTQAKEHKFKEKNPFAASLKKDQVPASEGYRYRRWKLPNDVLLVARTTVNAYAQKEGVTKFMSIRCLNQFDSKLSGNVDWREKLETQGGAVLATEMKNNMKKLARWIAEAHLAGAEELRIGFVARKNNRDPARHDILQVQRFKTDTFAASARVRLSHLWGVLNEIIKACRQLADGKYLILKDPNESKLTIYKVPLDAFSDETGDPFHDSPTVLGQGGTEKDKTVSDKSGSDKLRESSARK